MSNFIVCFLHIFSSLSFISLKILNSLLFVSETPRIWSHKSVSVLCVAFFVCLFVLILAHGALFPCIFSQFLWWSAHYSWNCVWDSLGLRKMCSLEGLYICFYHALCDMTSIGSLSTKFLAWGLQTTQGVGFQIINLIWAVAPSSQ